MRQLLTPSWNYAAHHGVRVLVVDGDDCFLTARHTRLVALETMTGRERWSYRIDNPWGWIAATDNTVFYLNQHSRLVALDRREGRLRWQRDQPGVNGWLHAAEERVVVGGWRGYTDVFAFEAAGGKEKWRYAPATPLHSTRIHAGSKTVVIADRANSGSLIFVDVETGEQRAAVAATGTWVEEMSEHPTGTSTASAPVILDCDDHAFFVVDGAAPALQRVNVPFTVWSRNLAWASNVVPFLDSGGHLVVWSLSEARAQVLGSLEHNRRDLLPFCRLGEHVFVAGTSFGHLVVYSHPSATAFRLRVGKRVSTQLTISNGKLVFGTDSGEVLGFTLQQDG